MPRLSRLRLVRLIVVGVAIGAVTMLCITAGLAALLSRAEPAWWTRPPIDAVPLDQASAQDRGRRVEEAVSRLISSAQPGLVTRTALYETDANAWLETRLPRWLESEQTPWPEEVSPMRLDARDGALRLGVRVTSEGWSRVVTLTLEPRIDTEGRLWAEARAMHVGRLRVPMRWVLAELDEPAWIPEAWRDDPRTRFAAAVFAGDQPLVETPVVSVDERRLRLTAIDIRDDRIDLEYSVDRKR